MSVKRKRIKVRHPDDPDSKLLSVEVGALEVDMTTPTAEDVDAIREMLEAASEAASDAGRAEFNKQVRAATAALAELAIRQQARVHEPRGRRDRNEVLARWLDEKFAADPRIQNRSLAKALPPDLKKWVTEPILKKEATAARKRAGLI